MDATASRQDNLNTASELLYDAINAPFGLRVQTTDPERVRQLCYAARREKQSRPDTHDPRLDALVIRLAPNAPTSEVWIIPQSAIGE